MLHQANRVSLMQNFCTPSSSGVKHQQDAGGRVASWDQEAEQHPPPLQDAMIPGRAPGWKNPSKPTEAVERRGVFARKILPADISSWFDFTD